MVKRDLVFTPLGMCQSDRIFLSPCHLAIWWGHVGKSHCVTGLARDMEKSGALPHQVGHNGRGLEGVMKVRARG